MKEIPFFVSENLAKYNNLFNTTSFSTESELLVDELIYRSLKILKTVKGENATLLDFYRLISNQGGEGRNMVHLFINKFVAYEQSADKIQRDIELGNYFLEEYYIKGSYLFKACRSFVARVYLCLQES